MTADRADGRTPIDLGRNAVISLRSGPVKARIDVVLKDGNDLAARIVFWDAPDFSPGQVPLLAAAYSEAMRKLFPEQMVGSIAIWQGRRQTRHEVSFSAAQAQLRRADEISATL